MSYPPQQQNPYGPTSQPSPYAAPGSDPYANPYGQMNPYAPDPAQRKPATLGVVGFVIVLIMAIAGIALAWLAGNEFAKIYDIYGENVPEVLPPEHEGTAVAGFGMLVASWVAGFIGLVGWIIAIVATAQNRGRLWGVLAIILGVIAPVIMLVIFFVRPVGALM